VSVSCTSSARPSRRLRARQAHELLEAGHTRGKIVLRVVAESEPAVGQIDVGGQPFAKVAKGIELLATKVAPAVRKAVAAR